MKSIRSIIIGLGLFALPIILQAQLAVSAAETSTSDSIVQLMAEAYGLPPMAREDLPVVGTFWEVLPNGILAPVPCPPLDESLPVYQMVNGSFLVDATGGQTSAKTGSLSSMTTSDAVDTEGNAVADLIEQSLAQQLVALDTGFPVPGPGGTPTNSYVFSLDTNRLWLEITNVSGGAVHASLHQATNQVYAIWATEDLLLPFAVATEIWPANTNCEPFTVPALNRDTLFLRAEDWTGKDSNADGVPDWWAWQYFSDVSLTLTNLDYSGSGLTFAEDYSNNITPTVFAFFSIQAANNYVQTSSPEVQLNMAGSPYFIAVLVDDTNFTSAIWNTYSGANISVNLGLVEGWHDVWIGLRGHGEESEDAIWQWKRLKLDTMPPALTITNPVAATVEQPVIQLQGWAGEALRSMTYDLTNAAGAVNNQLVMITGQVYDTNTFEFTTNYFHAYDVLLTNGLNVITLHAKDQAGNETMLSQTLTLDYNAKTNLPVVQLLWPFDKLEIVGSNIVCRGWVSDDTAAVTVQLVGATGETNTASSLVNREGVFYSDNLTLAAGTNYLSYTVRDAAGNEAQTNITVLTSDLELTLNPVIAGQSLVDGTIGDTNYTICVNGVRATIHEDHSWSAQITPIGVGGGAVVVNAVLGGGDPSVQQIVQPPEGVFVSQYHFDRYSEDYSLNDTNFSNPSVWDDNMHWADDVGGNLGEKRIIRQRPV